MRHLLGILALSSGFLIGSFPACSAVYAQGLVVSAAAIGIPTNSAEMLTVSVDGPRAFRALELRIQWDANIARFESIESHSAYAGWLFEANPIGPGDVRVALVGADSPPLSGEVFSIRLSTGPSPGTSPVTFVQLRAYDEAVSEISVTGIPGRIDVGVVSFEPATFGDLKAIFAP